MKSIAELVSIALLSGLLAVVLRSNGLRLIVIGL